MKPLFDYSDSLAGDVGVDRRTEGTDGDDTLFGTGGGDTIQGNKGDDQIHGLKGDDSVGGGQGDDVLFGGKGDDTLHGGVGSDRLVGGNGGDVFSFTNLTDSTVAADGRDSVADFHHGQGDVIDLSQIDADANVDGDQAFTVVGQFSGHAGELVLAETAFGFNVEGDVDGDGHADFEIAVHTVGSFGAGDFEL